MDTILKPRCLSNTESDSSEEEEDDNDKKDSSSSSKITIVPKEGTRTIQALAILDEEQSYEDLGTGESKQIVVCPTARFLQVNPKKVSSYDLLVLPPKRPKFIIDSSRENLTNGGGVSAFTQKMNPIPSLKSRRSPTLECIYFENEKLKYRETSKGQWSPISSSSSPRNASIRMSNPLKQANILAPSPPPRISLPRILSEEHTLRQIELAEENGNESIGSGGAARSKYDSQCPSQDNDDSSAKWKIFPITENYAYYAHWTPSFRQIYKEYDNERVRDENRNYLPDILSKEETAIQTEAPDLVEREQQVELPPPRTILRPTYHLRDLNERNNHESEEEIHNRSVTVFLKENDYDSLTEISLFHKDERNRNKPPRKKRKFNRPGEYATSDDDDDDEDEKQANSRGPTCELLYKGCNELTIESEVLSPENPKIKKTEKISKFKARSKQNGSLNSSQGVASIFRTTYHDDTSTLNMPPVNIQTRDEFSTIHHPDLRDLRSDSTTMETMGMTHPINVIKANQKSVEESEESEEDVETNERPFSTKAASYPTSSMPLSGHTMGHSPVHFFLSNSTGMTAGSNSELHFDSGNTFINFLDENEEEEIEPSRIEDVTDLIGDNSELVDIMNVIGSGHRDTSEMNTIFQAATFTSAGLIQDCSSGSCQLIDGLFKNLVKKNSRETIQASRGSLNSQQWEAQEVLMQPKPHLKISTSVHSTLERGLEPTSTTARFVEKKTKSDYFVGKVAGLTKSVMKMYHQPHSHSETTVENCSCNERGDMTLLESEGNSTEFDRPPISKKAEDHPMKPSSFGLGLENVKKWTKGNRVGDIGDTLESPMRIVKLQTSSSSSLSRKSNADLVKRKQPSKASEVPKKSILKKEKKQSIFKKIMSRLFGSVSKLKEKRIEQTKNHQNRDNNCLPRVPSSLLQRERSIVHHTDSRELYRERRKKFFKEQKDFHNESLATYVKSIASMLDSQESSQQTDISHLPTNIPLSCFTEKSVNSTRESEQDMVNNNSNRHRDTVSIAIPVRLATSASAILGPRDNQSSLVLRFPTFVQVLAAAMARRRSLQGNVNELERDKDKLKRPLKGILKKTNNNARNIPPK